MTPPDPGPGAAPDAPVPILHGRTTFLRAAERSDIPMLAAWVNDWRNGEFVSTRAPMSEALEERWFDRMLDRQGTAGWYFIVCRLEDARPVGNVGLMELDYTNGSAGIGITIGASGDKGQGYGGDALETLLDFGFGRLRLERMWLDAYDFNPRAIALYERLGFVREGASRHGAFRNGRFVDLVQLSILRDEWVARRERDPFPGDASGRSGG